ncbi:MAG: SpoIIE family protein phosphatase [Capsulimonadaceae bacterium]|nr:SpoIIE family protein phosphatase [Capsulimonadaceae bacterium]
MDSAHRYSTDYLAADAAEPSATHEDIGTAVKRLLDDSDDSIAGLTKVARLLTTAMADFCAFDLIQPDGEWRRVVVATPSSILAEIAAENARLFPIYSEDPAGPAQIHRTGASIMFDRVTDADLKSIATCPEHLKRLKLLGARSFICTPLIRDNVCRGVITLIRAADTTPFTNEDLADVESIAGIIGAALNRDERLDGIRPAAEDARIPDELDPSMLMSRCDALATFLDLTDETIIVTSLSGLIVYWNRAAEKTYGWKRDEAIGQAIHLLLRTEIPLSRDRLLEAVRRDGRWAGEIVNFRRDGTRVVCANRMYLYRNAIGEPAAFMEVGTDITEHQRAQRQLREAYEREHKIAEALQRSMLVDIRDKQFDGLSVAPIYQAAWDEALVGGDFYDVFELRKGLVALLVGDVSGKGLAAAQYTAEVKFATRAFLSEDENPATALERLNRYALRSHVMLDRDPTVFVAMSIAVIEPARGAVKISNAGMEPAMILRTNGKIDTVELGGKPIGLFDDEKYELVEETMASGDTMLLVTDGMTEARNGTTVLGYDGLMLLAKMASRRTRLSEMAETIMNNTRSFVGGQLHDDTCLVLARIE